MMLSQILFQNPATLTDNEDQLSNCYKIVRLVGYVVRITQRNNTVLALMIVTFKLQCAHCTRRDSRDISRVKCDILGTKIPRGEHTGVGYEVLRRTRINTQRNVVVILKTSRHKRMRKNWLCAHEPNPDTNTTRTTIVAKRLSTLRLHTISRKFCVSSVPSPVANIIARSFSTCTTSLSTSEACSPCTRLCWPCTSSSYPHTISCFRHVTLSPSAFM